MAKTVGEEVLRKHLLGRLNHVKKMGAGKMKIASEDPMMRVATIIKRITTKARLLPETTKCSHEKVAIGQASLTSVMNPKAYTNVKAVREAGPMGFSSPRWQAKLSEDQARDFLKEALIMPRFNTGERMSLGAAKKIVSMGQKPPTGNRPFAIQPRDSRPKFKPLDMHEADHISMAFGNSGKPPEYV